MIKITCVIVDDEPVARDILKSYVLKIPNLELVATCKNAMEAFEVPNQQKVDIFFLDINMPEVTGLSLAKLIQKKTKIIFTTAHREYAINGFDLDAVDYLLKPISFDRFLQAINKFLETKLVLNSKLKAEESIEKKEFLFVRSDRKMIKINFKEILYIESLSDYIKIYLEDANIVTRENISNIETKLPQKMFLRTHRSFIINFNRIDSYTKEVIEIDRIAIPISRTYKEIVLKKLADI